MLRCATEEASTLETSGNEKKHDEVTATKQFGDVRGDATWSNRVINEAVNPTGDDGIGRDAHL